MKTEVEIKDAIFYEFFDWYCEGFRPADCCTIKIELSEGSADIKYDNKMFYCQLTKTGRVKKDSFRIFDDWC